MDHPAHPGIGAHALRTDQHEEAHGQTGAESGDQGRRGAGENHLCKDRHLARVHGFGRPDQQRIDILDTGYGREQDRPER
ncbi:hypothetical protein D3C71_1741600 [compost metagenome]